MSTQTVDLSRMTSLLAAIAKQLDIITRHILPVAPNYRYPLKNYWEFNWDGIDAIVLKRDDEGPTLVKWGNYTWKRRSGGGKFGTAVWFSRPDGKDENGDTCYRRLVTFKDWSDPEPMDGRAATNGQTAAGDSHQTSPTKSEPPPAVVMNGKNGNHHANSASKVAPIASALPATPAAEWEKYARQTSDPVLFDKCFFNANPSWQQTAMVTRIRDHIGDIAVIGGDRMYDALSTYTTEYRKQRPMHDADTANSLALQEAWQVVATADTPLDILPVTA